MRSFARDGMRVVALGWGAGGGERRRERMVELGLLMLATFAASALGVGLLSYGSIVEITIDGARGRNTTILF